jgi:hypothetical protein
MIDEKLHQAIDALIARQNYWPNEVWHDAGWLKGSYTELYFRVNWQVIAEEFIPVLVIASISIKSKFQNQGILYSLLNFLEAKGYCVVIEQIHFTQLVWYFDRHGYTKIPNYDISHEIPVSMYKLPVKSNA